MSRQGQRSGRLEGTVHAPDLRRRIGPTVPRSPLLEAKQIQRGMRVVIMDQKNDIEALDRAVTDRNRVIGTLERRIKQLEHELSRTPIAIYKPRTDRRPSTRICRKCGLTARHWKGAAYCIPCWKDYAPYKAAQRRYEHAHGHRINLGNGERAWLSPSVFKWFMDFQVRWRKLERETQ